MTIYKLNPDGTVEPTDIVDWSADRVIDRTEIGEVLISTVFLPTDHNYGSGPPLVFETMVFGGPMGQEFQECQRYATKAEAVMGHLDMVLRVKTAT